MKKGINIFVFAAFSFYFLMSFGSLPRSDAYALYAAIYAASFAVPFAAALILGRILRAERAPLSFGADAESLSYFAPLVLPLVGLVILVSLAGSLLSSLVGIDSALVIDEPIGVALVIYALIPAIGEELVFRYIPIRFIAPHSRASAVFASAILFSAIHASLFQIPYAFVAGVAFAVIDIRCKSVLPSVLIHLVNNILGVLIAVFAGEAWLLAALIALGALMVLSIVIICVKVKRYYSDFVSIISHGSVSLTPPFMIFTAFMLMVAILFLYSEMV